jgi:hypothetical protein
MGGSSPGRGLPLLPGLEQGLPPAMSKPPISGTAMSHPVLLTVLLTEGGAAGVGAELLLSSGWLSCA